MICVVYVDDTIIAGPDSNKIDELIKDLGVSNEDYGQHFQLRDEDEVGDFLGIRLENTGKRHFDLTQTGLIDNFLKTTGMEESRANGRKSLRSDKVGDAFDQEWEYATIIGMFMYLSTNTRPDIVFLVHQCARFTHTPKQYHALDINKILIYLAGTRDKVIGIKPTEKLEGDCCVDADFAGL